MLRIGPDFPESLKAKKCTENIKGAYNRPIGEDCELRHRFNSDMTLSELEWSCINCQAIFKKESSGHYRKRYKIARVPAHKMA